MIFPGLRFARAAIWIALAVAAIAAGATELGYSSSVTPGMIVHFERIFGRGARGHLDGWKEFVRRTAGRAEQAGRRSGEKDLLGPVNGFFNRLPYITDQVHWGVADYWATPSEFLASDGGDCEDYAIAKYFTLRELGVPISRLRMVYAKTWQSRAARMVLAYYVAPGAEPLILDSLEGGIRPASDRPDLIPVYTFNDDELLYPQPGLPTIPVSTGSFWLWREVREKLVREQTY